MKASSFNKAQFFVLWLINPFISACLLFRNMKWVSSMAPYLLISFFFGFSFVIPKGSEADSVRYVEQLEELHSKQTSFLEFSITLYAVEGNLDLYQPVLTWLISRITGNYQWLFGIYSVVFGYFWFKSILFARRLMPNRLSLFFILLLFFFAFINPIWYINGVRMYTALGMFFYGLLQIHFHNNKKGYIFLILPLFVHFSLSTVLVWYVLFRILPTKNFTGLYSLYLITFFVGQYDFEMIRNYFEIFPGFLQSRQVYINEEYAEANKSADTQLAVHIKLYGNLLRYLIIGITSWIYFSVFYKKRQLSSNFIQFFALALVFSAFTNLASQIPTGGRFAVLSNLLVVFSFILYLSNQVKGNIPKIFQSMTILILLFVVVVQIRIGADYFGAFLFIGNPILNLFIQDTTPFIDFIKAPF